MSKPHECTTLVGRDSVEPHFERIEAGAASISGKRFDQETRSARASSVGRWGSTESHPTGLAQRTSPLFP